MRNGLPRILIIRLSAIGDVVRVLPALHGLRDEFPNAQIDWAAEPKSFPILDGNPALDDILVFERPEAFGDGVKAFAAFCRQVRERHYDVVIDFHGIFKSGLLSWCSGAPKRYGFARPRGQECSWLAANRRVKLASPRLNRVMENFLLCEDLIKKRRPAEVIIDVPIEVASEIDEFWEVSFTGAKLVVAMHAPVDRPEKQWPLRHFAELSDRLQADGRFDVLLTYGPGQRDIAEEVAARTLRNPIVAPITPNLKYYAGLVARADMYFGGDTGPMHIAAAMDTPVVAVFGGTDPAKHQPYGKPCEILYLPPSATDRKPTGAARLAQITSEQAYDACVRLAQRNRGRQSLGAPLDRDAQSA